MSSSKTINFDLLKFLNHLKYNKIYTESFHVYKYNMYMYIIQIMFIMFKWSMLHISNWSQIIWSVLGKFHYLHKNQHAYKTKHRLFQYSLIRLVWRSIGFIEYIILILIIFLFLYIPISKFQNMQQQYFYLTYLLFLFNSFSQCICLSQYVNIFIYLQRRIKYLYIYFKF